MDQVDLTMEIPLLIEDQNETVIYMDKFSDVDDDDEGGGGGGGQTLVEDEETSLLITNRGMVDDEGSIVRGEELVVEDGPMTESICQGDLIDGETFVVNESDLLLCEKTKSEFGVSKENLTEFLIDNNNFKESVKESEVYLNGQMIELANGGTAFVETGKCDANEVYTPIKLYNGSVIYMVSGTLYGNEGTELTDCKSEEKAVEVGVVAAPEQKQEKSKGFQCNYKNCNKSYTSFHHLKVHLRVHTGDRPFRCSVEGCNKAFSTGFGLKTHYRTHNGERPYTCNHENCEKGFKTSGDLQKHIRTHTGERPFLCPIPNCGRSFTTCNICKVHVRTHTGERPYKCTYPNCEKTFASVTNQKNHMRIHSGEKPYVCSVEKCGRRFTEYSSLYKHNMVHRQQPHLCLICGKTYRQASGLMMHTKTAHGDHETFLMIDQKATEGITRGDEQTAILLVNNIKLEDGVLEDPLFA